MRPLHLVLASTLLTTLAWAGDPVPTAEEEEIVYSRVTEHIFDGVNVSAGVVGPSGQLVIEPKRLVFPPAFRLREDFNAEMEASVKTVR